LHAGGQGFKSPRLHQPHLEQGFAFLSVREGWRAIENDPNLTNKKFRGNPTKSFRTREPLRVTGEIGDWQGHSPEALKAMKDGLERLKRLDVEPID
jgi:hypothetical protein